MHGYLHIVTKPSNITITMTSTDTSTYANQIKSDTINHTLITCSTNGLAKTLLMINGGRAWKEVTHKHSLPHKTCTHLWESATYLRNSSSNFNKTILFLYRGKE